ncbi:MAG: class I SAM-dependent methyltransferase [Candidatus Omnitrophica bacterium]|nr:class I SAM-dependent methyltransferase [Candidatus Omnitrophota bacterium]
MKGQYSKKRFTKPVPKGFVTPQKARIHAEVLTRSVIKKFRHLSRRFKRQDIECFRLYDWDSPDIRIVVDWYGGHIVVAEYERLQTGSDYLPQMADAVANALNVPFERVHIKRRHTNVAGGPRYKKMGSQGKRIEVSERDLRFLVNLTDFLDTGLYSDHRDTRVIIRDLAKGKDFLNLFAYTGTCTCAAALGKAKATVTVDRSKTYIDWTKDNLMLNGLWGVRHRLTQSDVMKYLSQAARTNERFTLAFVDPPSFFKDLKGQVSFDINRDHPDLIKRVLKVMAPGGDIFFSTNHQRFVPRFDGIEVKEIVKLTPKTIPEDYRNRTIHHLWRMKV